MLQVLALVVPLGLAGAISPVLLTEQTVMLAGPGGRRAGAMFALGAIVTLAVFVGALVLFGRSIELPKEPHLSAGLDIVLGVGLVAIATFLQMHETEEKAEKPPRAMGTQGALVFGCVSMATNFTTLALMVPGAKEIAASHLDLAERAVIALVLVILSSIPVWVPLALTAVAPATADRGLNALGDFISKYGRRATVVLLAGFGAYLLSRGIYRLAD
jgi:threonine/homoserine/homoserine lactone efflux protein